MAYYSNRATKNESLLHKYQDIVDNIRKLIDIRWDGAIDEDTFFKSIVELTLDEKENKK
tara:strand:- start:4763 stop:4939 length:177 start_codon:yes stop_codon:yes gene_type:complete